MLAFSVSLQTSAASSANTTPDTNADALQAADIQVDINASVQQTEIDSKFNAHAWNLCKLGALRSVAILASTGWTIEGQTWPVSHEILFSRATVGHSAGKTCSSLSATDIPQSKMPTPSLRPPDRANRASDSQHPCAPTLTPVYSRDFTDA
ncbi:hypothetical protein MKX08_005700 [Trichoderma sp. CBMAI-0020]|nr:hypothetical protein MKX08_005700 [Trichoderma sp. CBMAI-0020]